MLDGGNRLRTAWTVGVLGTVAVATTCFVLPDTLPKTVPALVLLVPVCVASAMAGWRVGVAIAFLGAAVYSVAFIPPIGRFPVHLTEDVYVLIAFVTVAVLVGVVSGRDRADDRSELLDEDRAMLLRSVSHDLRTPLSTIQTVSTDLRDGVDYDEATQRELMALVAHEATRLNRIVGNLLSVSRVQAGAFEPAVEPTQVRSLVDDAVERAGGDARVSFVTRLDEDLPDVLADPVQIDQVLANLLENSARHAPPSSRVVVAASRRGGTVRITVEDEGPGFDAQALESVFGSAPAAPGPHGGTGLGLTVCRAIVQAHGGEIWADPSSRGAAVTFTLPVSQVA